MKFTEKSLASASGVFIDAQGASKHPVYGCLLLEPVDQQDDTGPYRRIGTAEQRWNSDSFESFMSQGEVGTITII